MNNFIQNFHPIYNNTISQQKKIYHIPNCGRNGRRVHSPSSIVMVKSLRKLYSCCVAFSHSFTHTYTHASHCSHQSYLIAQIANIDLKLLSTTILVLSVHELIAAEHNIRCQITDYRLRWNVCLDLDLPRKRRSNK